MCFKFKFHYITGEFKHHSLRCTSEGDCFVFIFNATHLFIYLFIQVLKSIDDLLFSLLILKGLSNSSGQIWRCLPTQLYAIEITLPSDHVSD